ncbi:response regulator transcription factor [Aliiroseovarius sp. KMU-50]|uniref:Response regulator transcription factor n=1 Tax=Aliiroseovarius salicola TaxID=3009082 RepID=A0ABT4W3T2_9RHOB|nr:response regulator transcription factor [Aliiroseovarius sp. KMU-50]MDA5095175.1 response regulator transcription factor [Aliiroseovarius sp. KMU-50]
MNILLAAETPTLSNLISATFSEVADLSVTHVSTATAAQTKLDSARGQAPIALVVLDYALPGLSGLNGVRQLAKQLPNTPMVLVLRGGTLELSQRAHRAGANGVVAQNLLPDDMSNALKIARSGLFVSVFADELTSADKDALTQLSDREMQVLKGLCTGMQNKEIAHTFSIQEVTVKMHMRSIVGKLGAKNRTHAALIARDLGLA